MAETDHDLLVIGGGPAGATTSTLAAKAGLDVLMLEAAEHPRAHVGESLLPGIIPILAEMGVLEEAEAAGFQRKSGATFWNWGRTSSWDLWFSDTELYDHAWLVDRSRFDALLFDAARRGGVDARENAIVRGLVWEGDRLVGARWAERGSGTEHIARAGLVVDASGSAALVAKELELREVVEGLEHQASWAYWENVAQLDAPRSDQALFVAEPGYWVWLFPIDATRTSIGIIELDREGATTSDYEARVRASARLSELVSEDARRASPVHRERDWSYRMRRVTGPGWMSVGDASGFIDPILSTGVFLSMTSARDAAHAAVAYVREGDEEALADYQREHRGRFEDLLRMVRFYYEQNVHAEDYFWESKRILMTEDKAIRPQKAFLILTSGLVANLAFDELRAGVEEQRASRVGQDAPSLSNEISDELGFVCLHLRWRGDAEPVSLWFLIEPKDPVAPSLFTTRSFHLNALAPRFDNDPISHPPLAPHLRALHQAVDSLDDRDESLASFWRRAGARIVAHVDAVGDDVERVRVFGE